MASKSLGLSSLLHAATGTVTGSGILPDGKTVSVNGACIAHEPAALFLKIAAIKVSDANCRPAKLGHNLREPTIRTRGTLALWHFKNVHHRLRADALQAVEACRPSHALQPQPPRVYGLRGFGLHSSWRFASSQPWLRSAAAKLHSGRERATGKLERRFAFSLIRADNEREEQGEQ